jgi:hypothetical protein
MSDRTKRPTCDECGGSGKSVNLPGEDCYKCEGDGVCGLSPAEVDELRPLMERIESGREDLQWEEHPLETFAGNVGAKTSDGWVVVCFIDCNDWDYVDSVVAPDGRVWEFKSIYYGPLQFQDAICDWWQKRGHKPLHECEYPPPPGPWPQPKASTP